MNQLCKRLCDNRWSLSANKTKHIILRYNNQRFNNDKHSVQIDGVKLCQIGLNHIMKKNWKFIDEFLTWKNHINLKISREIL